MPDDLQSLIDSGQIGGAALQRVMDRMGIDPSTMDLGSLQRGQQAYDNRLTPQSVQDYLTQPAFDYMKRDYPAGPLEQASDAVVNTAANVMPGAGKAAEIAGAAMTPAAIAAMKDMLAGGKTFGEIADALGLSRSTIAGKANRMGLQSVSGQVSGGGRPVGTTGAYKYTDDVVSQIRDLNSQGMTQTQIAQQLGVPQSGVSKALTSSGIRGRPALEDDTVSQINDLASRGMTQRDIAKQLGVSQTSVARTTAKAGIAPQNLPGSKIARGSQSSGRVVAAPSVKTPGLPDLSPAELADYERTFSYKEP